MIRQVAYLISVMILMHSCVKEDSALPPTVNFELPIENSIYNIPDTIQVRAHISSEQIIESVDVRVVDLSYVPHSETIQVHPNAISYDLNEFVIVENIYIESGTYYIEIIARSSGETKRKYLQIVLNEFPLEYQKLVAIHENGMINLVEGIVDSVQIDNFNLGSSNAMDVAIVDNYHQQVVIGYDNGSIRSYSIEDNSLIWEIGQNNPISSVYYNDVFLNDDDRTIYFSTYYGRILGYDEFGNSVNLIEVGENNKAEEIYIDGENTIVEVVSLSGSDRSIKVFSTFTGSLLSSAAIEMDVANIIKIGEGEYLVAGDGNGSEQLAVYYESENAFFYPQSFDIGSVIDIDVASSGSVAVAHSTGVYVYQTGTNSLYLINSSSDIIDVEYDIDNDMLIMSSVNLVEFYSFQNSAVISEIYIPQPIKAIDILYNK